MTEKTQYEIDVENAKKIITQLPFLSAYTQNENLIIGFVQYEDVNALSIYELTNITDADDRANFLRLCTEWYEKANHAIPISVYNSKEMRYFNMAIARFNPKKIEKICGFDHDFTAILKTSRKRTIRRQID